MSKVALIMGSGKKRIGNYVALALADLGYSVVIHYNRSKKDAEATVKELQAKGIKARALQADITEEEQIRQLVETVVKEFGRIDVLVNSASGLFQPIKWREMTKADFMRAFEVNTVGSAVTAKFVAEQMVKQKEGGLIINFSDWALIRPYLDYVPYLTSKGGVPVFSMALAKELAAENPKVRVNYISPGPVMLPEDMSEEDKAEAIEETLVKREGSPKAVVEAVIYLINNDFVTGTNLFVDGGKSIN